MNWLPPFSSHIGKAGYQSHLKHTHTIIMNKTSMTLLQTGQAMIETITVLLIFLILLLSIQLSTSISDSREGLLAQGLTLAISSARGATLSNGPDTVISRQTSIYHGNIRSAFGTDIETNTMRELGMRTHSWSTSTGQDVIAIHSMIRSRGVGELLAINTNVQVKGFPTHASDSEDAVKHLSQTTNLWGKPASLTNKLSKFVTAQAHLSDAAWKRPAPTQDLLMSWRDW